VVEIVIIIFSQNVLTKIRAILSNIGTLTHLRMKERIQGDVEGDDT